MIGAWFEPFKAGIAHFRSGAQSEENISSLNVGFAPPSPPFTRCWFIPEADFLLWSATTDKGENGLEVVSWRLKQVIDPGSAAVPVNGLFDS